MEEARKECKLVLYDKFFGRTPLELVKNIMPKIWKIKSECNVVDLSASFFAFKFSNEEDYWEVFSGGPWFLRGQTLSLISWRENFQPLKESIEVVTVWIQFPGLLFEYLHENIIPQLVVVIGRPLKIDEYTLSGTRGKFVRVQRKKRGVIKQTYAGNAQEKNSFMILNNSIAEEYKIDYDKGNCNTNVNERKDMKIDVEISKNYSFERRKRSSSVNCGKDMCFVEKVVVEKENRSNKKIEEMNVIKGAKRMRK
ncbi:hypothetical protein Cni_G19357 [Canna indica]|uniref:DUF4283 domain-containing protein n=1 Tax=Canna indica TaxID=4628 RepID=A0AAQ3KPC1_9LILI|nr:hypothetical protein Cni_G19357 [Canna indica]